jgi:hypothetical protein
MVGKVVFIVVLMLLFACAAGAGFYGYGGKNMIEEGMDSLSCTAARVLNFTVNGNDAENFIGMLPMLDEFSNLKGILNDGSSFITEMNNIMDQTIEVEEATFVAAQTTGLLQQTLAQTGNLHPVPTVTSESVLHKCVMCEQLVPLLAQAKTELENGVATALANARGEVESQMSSTNRATLRDSFDTSIAPLTEAKDMVRDTTKAFLTDDFMDLKSLIMLAGAYSCNAISVCIFGIGTCAFLGALCCLVQESSDRRSKEERDAASPASNPYNRYIAPCAGVTWCCGFLYAFFVFLLAGLMIVAAVPFSSMCLVMDDIDSQMLKDIGPGLGLNTSGDDMEMIADMIDTCFSRVTNKSNKSLMDIVFIEENNTKITIKEKIQGQTTDMINQQFSNVDAMLSGSANVLLLQNPNVQTLLDFLDNPFDVAIVPEAAQGGPVQSSSTYNKVAIDPRTGTGSGVEIAFGTSMSCTDFLYQPPTGAATTVYGISSLLTKLQGFTSSALLPSSPVGTCTNKVDCNKNPVTNSAINCNLPTTQNDVFSCQACQSANDWMDLKAQLESSSSYRCDIFQDANGNDCDVLNMVKVNNVWTNDCFKTSTNADGTMQYMMTPKAKSCNLAGFKSYMANWKARLTLVYDRVDKAQDSTKTGIQVSLKDHVDKYVTNPVNSMVAKAQGSFLKAEYADLVDALCYKGVVGFRKLARAYAANGAFTLFLILFSYSLWRHGVDNRNSWRDKMKNVEALNADSVVPVPVGDKPNEAWQS